MLFIFSKKEGILKTLEVLLASRKPVCFNSEQDLLSKKEEASLIIIDEEVQLIPKLFGKTVLFLGQTFSTDGNVTFLEKPFTSSALSERLSFIENLAGNRKTLKFSTPVYSFDATLKTLKTNDDTFHLTEKETQIICFLDENREKTVSKETLLAQIFGYKEETETHTVETHIYKLRQKIKDETGRFIQTTDGGYTLSAV